jgi:antitoxin PrlF
MMISMVIAQSKITAQGQISVPAEVRRKLGLGPGSVLEWDEEGENIVVRRAGLYTLDDLHRAAFPEGPPKHKTLKELKESIGDYMRERYGKR